MKNMCFGFNLCQGNEGAIEQFKITYLNLGIPVSLKVYTVFEHVVQNCKKHNSGLSLYSENSLESSHYDFKPF